MSKTRELFFETPAMRRIAEDLLRTAGIEYDASTLIVWLDSAADLSGFAGKGMPSCEDFLLEEEWEDHAERCQAGEPDTKSVVESN
jgi:hypothetical protein